MRIPTFFLNTKTTCLLVILTASLLGCSSNPPMLSMVAEPTAHMNRSAFGEPLSTVINIYWLKSDADFNRMTFEQFLGSDGEYFADSLIERHEYVLVPGKSITLTDEIPENASYFGVTAFFQTPASDGWRVVQPVKLLKEAEHPFHIQVGECRLIVREGDQSPPPEAPCAHGPNEATVSKITTGR